VGGVRRGGGDLNDVSLTADSDQRSEVTLQSIDLDSVLNELLEVGGIEDLVVGGLLAVDGVLLHSSVCAFSEHMVRVRTYHFLLGNLSLGGLFEKHFSLLHHAVTFLWIGGRPTAKRFMLYILLEAS
jgi:hypothetical protein